jgi:hypothetical protein
MDLLRNTGKNKERIDNSDNLNRRYRYYLMWQQRFVFLELEFHTGREVYKALKKTLGSFHQ